MPDTMKLGRMILLKALGAGLVLILGSEGMRGAVKRVEESVEKTPNSFMPHENLIAMDSYLAIR
jgi:cysteine synthase A